MVAKRDLSPRFSSQVPKSPTVRSRGTYAQRDSIGANSRSSHANADGTLPLRVGKNAVSSNANSYSEAVAHNVQRKRQQYYRAKATEAVIVIIVNVALSMAAIAAITKLLPYQSSQKERLEEITTEVNTVEQKVNQMREQLPQTLNSGKSQEMLLRSQGFIKPNQVSIKLINPSDMASPDNNGVMPTTTTAQGSNNR